MGEGAGAVISADAEGFLTSPERVAAAQLQGSVAEAMNWLQGGSLLPQPLSGPHWATGRAQ